MHTELIHLEHLMKGKSNLKDLQVFQESINIIFHDIEAKYYDQLHSEMWDSLQHIYNLFMVNVKRLNIGTLKILDVGCGTGLSSKMLIESPIGSTINKIFLLDTSSGMLQKAKERFSKSKITFETFQGDINSLQEENFDFILVSSVLHHIPNLADFFIQINKRLKKGGILFHIHDPNGDAIKNKLYLERTNLLRAYNAKKNNRILIRLFNKIKILFQAKKSPDYISEVNTQLLEQKIIHTKLTEQEIWSVTDIHVEDLPYSTNKGISLSMLKTMLPNFELITSKSYSFFGIMYSKLPSHFKSKELDLLDKNDKNGRNFGCVWRKK